jgi:photosystem II stability/assembly factor-like uncharacterized protein
MTAFVRILPTALLLAVSIHVDAVADPRRESDTGLPGDDGISGVHTEVLDPFGRRVLADEFGRFARPANRDVQAGESGSLLVEAAERSREVAATSGWDFVGPEGGNVVDIAASPTRPGLVIAALGYGGLTGLYRSTDGGTTWTLGLRGVFEEFLCIVFAADGTPYAGSSSGVYEGNADGTAWQRVGPLYYQSRISSIVVHPTRPNEIWVGATTYGQTSPILRSTDRGRTWQSVAIPGYPYRTCSRILFDPANSNKVYACFADYGAGPNVWFSPDAGTTWVSRAAQLPQFPMNDLVHDGTRLWVCGGQLFDNQRMGVWTSPNEGLSWNRVSPPLWQAVAINDLELDPLHPGTILAATDRGIHRTTDNGATWSLGIGGTSGYYMNVVKIIPGTSTILGGAESYGIQSCRNAATTFTASNSGIRALGITCVAANPIDPLEMTVGFAGNNTGGLSTSRDGGVTWNTEPVPRSRWLRVRYTDDRTLYGLTGGPSDVTGEGVYRRNPDGSWRKLGPDFGPRMENYFWSFHVSSSHPDQIVVGGIDNASPYNYHGVIWRTENGGAWTRRYDGQPFAYVWDLESADEGQDRILLGTTNGAVLRSEDGGSTWGAITEGLPSMVSPRWLSQSPVNPALVYVTSEYPNGLFRSTDAGRHWSPLAGLSGAKDIVCDPTDPRVLYTTPNYSESTWLMRSEDGGQTFVPFAEGLEAGTGFSFAVIASPCPQLLLATGGGIMRRAIDRTPPDLSIGLDSPVVWPPNGHHVSVHVTALIHDACDPAATFVLTSITANEPLEADDIRGAEFGTPDVDFELRSERLGSGNGRRYLVTYTATDALANARTATAEVFVPRDQRGGRAFDEAIANPAQSTQLAPIAPNPFRHGTEIGFTLSRAQRVAAEVFDARGGLVRRLASGDRAAGSHRLNWDGRDESGGLAPSGIYLIRLATEEGHWMRRAVLVR